MNDNFDSLFEIIESWQGSREGICQRAVQWVASPAFVSTYYDNAHVPPKARAVMREGMGLKEAEKVWSSVKDFGVQSPELFGKYRALSRSGRVVFAHMVIANPGFATLPDKNLPCLMTVSADQGSAPVATAGILASALADLYLTGAGAKEHPKTLRLVRDDDFQLLRRRKLPPEEINGFKGLLLDVLMRKSWMPPDTLPFVPLLLSSERGGAVVQIPWYVVMGESPKPEDLESGIWHEIAELGRPASSSVAKAGRGPQGSGAILSPERTFPATLAKTKFSIRILLLRIVAILVTLGIIAQFGFVFVMEKHNFETGALGAYQQSILAENGIASWEALTPGDLGRLAGAKMLPLIFSIFALIGAFRRSRTTSLISNLLLTVSGFGHGSLPLGPLAALGLSVIPGRTSVWKKS
jgi:hypothetical protein